VINPHDSARQIHFFISQGIGQRCWKRRRRKKGRRGGKNKLSYNTPFLKGKGRRRGKREDKG